MNNLCLQVLIVLLWLTVNAFELCPLQISLNAEQITVCVQLCDLIKRMHPPKSEFQQDPDAICICHESNYKFGFMPNLQSQKDAIVPPRIFPYL
ncbi:UNVERIFIED_CONTAM: hypothetical protein FKN15_055375 [Acipenser sinensis]